MPRSRWGIVVAAVGLVALALSLAIGFQQLDYSERYQPPPNTHANPSPNGVANMARMADALESIRDDQQSADSSERGRRDLDAQERAARWTKWSAWASIIQLIVSGIGLAALIYTLQQTDHALAAAREANAITACSVELENRPIMVPDGMIFRELEYHDAVEFALRWKNIGKLPAYVSVAASRRVGPGENRTLEGCLARPVGEGMASAISVVPAGETVMSSPHVAFKKALASRVDSYSEIGYRSAVGEENANYTTRAHGPLHQAEHLESMGWKSIDLPDGRKVNVPDPKFKVTGYVFQPHGNWIEMT